jgi:hypothetical protein
MTGGDDELYLIMCTGDDSIRTSSASSFGALRQLDPFPSNPEPSFLVERAYRVLCLLAAFLGLLAEFWLLRFQT